MGSSVLRQPRSRSIFRPDDATDSATPSAARFDLLTVDVWDTLLRRRCHPDCVKLHVCRVLLLAHAEALPAINRDLHTLLRIRQQAEHELGEQCRKRGFDDEYCHRDVYAKWLQLAQFARLDDPHEMAGLLRMLERAELAQERRVSYADPSIASTLAEYPAGRVLFLSDFYLPGAAIAALLSTHGLEELAQSGIVSCEVGFNKRSGRLFSHLHERLSVSPARHLHIGDSIQSDVEPARRQGVTSIHYQPEAEHARRVRTEAGFRDRQQFLRDAVEGMCSSPPPNDDLDAAIHAYGCRCSPIFVGFVLDVMERATASRASRVHFLTREGEFFREIYGRLAEHDVLGVPVPDGALLHVSRLATFAASLRAFSADELMRIWNQYSIQSIGALLASLGLTPADFAKDAERFDLDLDVLVRYPWQDARVLGFIGDRTVRAKVEPHLLRKREDLRAYLAQAGLPTPGETAHIADIGWRGTIHDNLAHVLDGVPIRGYYLGLSRYLNPQPAGASKSAFGPNLNETPSDAALLDFVAPIEMLCNSVNGSVREYHRLGGRVEVLRQIDQEENAVFFACARHFQQGVLDSVPLWADFLRTHAYTASEVRPLALERWREIIHRPPTFLARAYFQLNHNETFGVGGFDDKRNQLSLFDLAAGFVSARRRDEVNRFLARIGWIPGMLARPDIGPAFRATLRTYLWLRRAKQQMVRALAGK